MIGPVTGLTVYRPCSSSVPRVRLPQIAVPFTPPPVKFLRQHPVSPLSLAPVLVPALAAGGVAPTAAPLYEPTSAVLPCGASHPCPPQPCSPGSYHRRRSLVEELPPREGFRCAGGCMMGRRDRGVGAMGRLGAGFWCCGGILFSSNLRTRLICACPC